MNKIHIDASIPYDVCIENGLINSFVPLITERFDSTKVLIVTDSNVEPLYLKQVADCLSDAGISNNSITIPAGDASKNLDNFAMLLNVLSLKGFTKSDLIIALGGGMIGDLSGYVASSYMRGIPFIQFPTTLLAAVDSSVGGKTAINLPAGKNQVGSIYNPALVICDPSLNKSLPRESLLDGYAETIKYGVLDTPFIIDSLRLADRTGDFTNVISTAVSIKQRFVEADENDMALRQYLNLGHLLGHAIEACSDFNISHGRAVATGMVLESRGCARAGWTDPQIAQNIETIVTEFGFDSNANANAEELLPFLMHDKRIRHSKIGIIVPDKIGSCHMKSIPAEKIPDFLNLCVN